MITPKERAWLDEHRVAHMAKVFIRTFLLLLMFVPLLVITSFGTAEIIVELGGLPRQKAMGLFTFLFGVGAILILALVIRDAWRRTHAYIPPTPDSSIEKGPIPLDERRLTTAIFTVSAAATLWAALIRHDPMAAKIAWIIIECFGLTFLLIFVLTRFFLTRQIRPYALGTMVLTLFALILSLSHL